jgi:hypothetical protein
MHELPEIAEVRAAWLNQPDEEFPVGIERIRRRRTWELFSTTRSEIISSIGAALFFVSIVAWRFAPERDRLVQLVCIAVIVWAAVTVFRFRSSIWRPTPRPGALARTGVEHYRAELLRRRNHLRSAWIWHGPLLLACILSAATFTKGIVPVRLWDALPVLLLLAAWSVIGIKRRVRQAAELQQEIDEISGISTMDEV